MVVKTVVSMVVKVVENGGEKGDNDVRNGGVFVCMCMYACTYACTTMDLYGHPSTRLTELWTVDHRFR